MTAHDLLDRALITEAWNSLGGGPLRHGRGKAFWRDGDGDNVVLDDNRGVWFDHSRGEGGGILDLVQTVLGCDRRNTLRWLADHLGVMLDSSRTLTRAEKRQYAQRRNRAESEARSLTVWRRDTLSRLRADRNRLYLSEQMTSAVARVLMATPSPNDEAAWDDFWKHALDDQRGNEVNRQIETFEKATASELIAMRQQREGRSA